jgi:hypothetical protein
MDAPSAPSAPSASLADVFAFVAFAPDEIVAVANQRRDERVLVGDAEVVRVVRVVRVVP